MEAQGSVCLSLRVFARSVLPYFGYHAPTVLTSWYFGTCKLDLTKFARSYELSSTS